TEQTYSNLEIIIIDDGSTDDTAKIVKSINDDRIKYHYQSNTGLPAQARNKGARLSKGRFMAFLDHDDVWMPRKLETQISIIEDNQDIGLICTNALYICDGKRTMEPLVKGIRSGYLKPGYFIPRNGVIQSTILVKRDIFDKVSGFNESLDLFAIEDYDFWIRVYTQRPCYYIHEPMIYYRKIVHSASGKESQVLQRGLHHYNKYFLSYGFSKKINQARLFEILAALYFRWLFLGDKKCGECVRSQKLSASNLFVFLLWIIFSLPFKFRRMCELMKDGMRKDAKCLK
ncbi:MAG: glycosyltransferase, partial [Candidatus Omnitrophica bacterium]|nr:glycosyltransferase [Candidatus Omnitrophota bacterium]